MATTALALAETKVGRLETTQARGPVAVARQAARLDGKTARADACLETIRDYYICEAGLAFAKGNREYACDCLEMAGLHHRQTMTPWQIAISEA